MFALVLAFHKRGAVLIQVRVDRRVSGCEDSFGLLTGLGPRPSIVPARFQSQHPESIPFRMPSMNILSAHVFLE
jgi:hypothetical protein